MNPEKKPQFPKPRANDYTLCSDAVMSGIRYGWHRAHKHVESPQVEDIINAIHSGVMGYLDDSFRFKEVE